MTPVVRGPDAHWTRVKPNRLVTAIAKFSFNYSIFMFKFSYLLFFDLISAEIQRSDGSCSQAYCSVTQVLPN